MKAYQRRLVYSFFKRNGSKFRVDQLISCDTVLTISTAVHLSLLPQTQSPEDIFLINFVRVFTLYYNDTHT